MLYDKEFLLKLDKEQHKVVYARVTALTFQEAPIEYIEGRVTQGSISLDGASAVRRTCSLTIAAPGFNYNDYYWGLNTKFKLEIGVENHIDNIYPDIIWFNQGIYLITSFSTSQNTSTLNISIQGKDKMCLLNGDIGGSLESSVDFGTIEEEAFNGIWTIRKIAIPEIIKNMIHTYAGEPYHNIIINDLETYGLELLEYRYDTAIYLYRGLDSVIYSNALIEDNERRCNVYQINEDNSLGKKIKSNILLKELEPSDLESLVDNLVLTKKAHAIKLLNNDKEDGDPHFFTKIEYGQVAGYRATDLVYAGDLIANAGESITSVLDKIKTMLTEFEYFYNLEGQFVFQKKQSVKEAMWSFNDFTSPLVQESLAHSTEHAYKFLNRDLFTAFNNSPNLLNLRNDYSIWGERESISGVKIPVHLRYAIDKKPTHYNKIIVEWDNIQVNEYNKKYGANISYQPDPISFDVNDYDWREIIYQMALDYYAYNFLDDFELRVAAANPNLYPTGRTGYEQYYTDLQGFWREIYFPHYEDLFNTQGEIKVLSGLHSTINALMKELYQGNDKANDYGIENDLTKFVNANETGRQTLMALWYDSSKWGGKYKYDFMHYDEETETTTKITNSDEYYSMLNYHHAAKKTALEQSRYQLEQEELKYVNYDKDDYYTSGDYKYWNRKVLESPDQINFWFDFLDASGELAQFSVPVIGSRPKVVNDTNVKSIYFRETPAVIYGDGSTSSPSGYRYIQASNIDHMFACSAQGKSAKDKLNELIYQHSYCIENATITSVPIYYLEPNTRIYLYDETAEIDGDYIVSKLTIPLTYNGTMSITATKAAENIL